MSLNNFESRLEKVRDILSRINKKIAIISGKGGVGKTTVAINLAVTLAEQGSKVGLLDADINCPNINKLIGIKKELNVKGNKIGGVKKFGIKVMSMALLQEKEDTPIIWRGPLLSRAVIEFIEKVEWGNLDYLIIDLPPGTGDLPLTVMQYFDLDGVIVVTTPQEVATLDAKKSINMAKEMNTCIVGLIENMAGDIFGIGGGEKIAKHFSIPFLGRIYLDKRIACDDGVPFVKKNKSKNSIEFNKIVNKIRSLK